MTGQRFALLGLALAVFGVAACSETIVPPPPDPALVVTVTPPQVDVTVGQSAQFVASVTGGPVDGVKTVTWSSSNTAVATIAANGNVVTVTGAGAGVSTIRAVATADANVSAAGVVNVTDPGSQIPTISIQSITAGATNLPVNEQNVFGQVEITLNLEVPQGARVNQVKILAGTVEIYSQTFTSPELAASADEAMSAIPIVASWNTAQLAAAINWAAGNVAGRHANGPVTISAQVVGPQGTVTASTNRQIVLNNLPYVIVRQTGPTGTACVIGGTPPALWCAGDNTFEAVGVDYSGVAANAIASLTLTASTGATLTDGASPFAFNLQRAATPAASSMSTVQTTNVGFAVVGLTSGGSPSPGCVKTDATPTPLNNACTAASGAVVLANPLNIDHVAPTLGGAISLPGGSNNWIGPNVTVLSLTTGVTATDAGVAGIAHNLQFASPSTSTTFTTVANTAAIAESTTNTAYSIRDRVCDALTNCANSAAVVVGSDHTPPVDPVTYTGATPADMAIIRNIASGANAAITAALSGGDALSGPFDTFGTLQRHNPNNSVTCVVAPVGSTCPAQSNILGATFTIPATAATGYWLFTDPVFRDLARNTRAPAQTSRTWISDFTAPLVQNIVLPGTLPSGGQAAFSATATDDLDLWNYDFRVQHGSPVTDELAYAGSTLFPTAAFGPPLLTSSPVTATVDFIRSIEFTTAGGTGQVPTGTLVPATGARFDVRDYGNNSSSAFNNFAAGTVPAGTSATALGVNDWFMQQVGTAPTTICATATTPCPSSIPVEGRTRGLSGTFNFPFSRVVFHQLVVVGGVNRYLFLGSTTARTSTDTGVTGDAVGRVWIYGPVTINATQLTVGANSIVATGVDANGDALISVAFTVTRTN